MNSKWQLGTLSKSFISPPALSENATVKNFLSLEVK